ncbi:hypothetical protein F5144DRAFT_599974 [Chaetomium tenue]|uniref:Uncharacterized protein n=1 Tax=Chaetomium tenue TaxID=1854479 RepID=A0ACB7PJU3_9PEZI|nr:hypothetical protein F5144DRAFT_599974 [Chaetomium globosum]
MAEPFPLDEYRWTGHPRKLWRVTHGNSQSRWDHGDLLAADDSRVFHDEAELKEAVEDHINWYSSQPSCFLSVFNDENHAVNWAAQRGRRDPPAYIHEIDTARLPIDTEILDMELLMDKLGIENPYSAHELLFLHRIPSQCIVRSRAVSGTQHETSSSEDTWWQTTIEQEETTGFDFSEFPLYDSDEDYYDSEGLEYGYGWGGYDDRYDSDESAEERNRNDDLLKMIDGLWD